MAVNGQTVEQGLLAEEWRRANDHLIGLEKAEAGIADGVTSSPLPSSLNDLAERVRAQPSFVQTFQFVPVEFGMVELDRLVVHQKFINLSFIGFLKSTVSEKPTEIDIAKVAFAIDQPLPVHQMQTAPNAFSFLCASNDFRVLDTSLLQPQQVLAPSGGRPVGASGD